MQQTIRIAPIEEALGNPTNPSYIPNLMLDFGSEMNFRERLLNTMFHTVMKICTGWFLPDLTEGKIKEATGIEDDLNLRELTHKASFSLINRAGNGGVMVCKFVDILCDHPFKLSDRAE